MVAIGSSGLHLTEALKASFTNSHESIYARLGESLGSLAVTAAAAHRRVETCLELALSGCILSRYIELVSGLYLRYSVGKLEIGTVYYAYKKDIIWKLYTYVYNNHASCIICG